MIRRQFLGLTALLLIATSAVQAADKGFSGKWLSVFERNGNKFESTIELKQDGDKVTGTISGRGGMKIDISDAKVSEDTLTFKIVREREGNRFESAYSVKVDGDVLKGKVSMEIMGEKREREFEAKRVD